MSSKFYENHNSQEKAALKLITLYLPELYIKQLDELVDARFYPNRAEAIRLSIHDMLSVYRRFYVKEVS